MHINWGHCASPVGRCVPCLRVIRFFKPKDRPRQQEQKKGHRKTADEGLLVGQSIRIHWPIHCLAHGRVVACLLPRLGGTVWVPPGKRPDYMFFLLIFFLLSSCFFFFFWLKGSCHDPFSYASIIVSRWFFCTSLLDCAVRSRPSVWQVTVMGLTLSGA